MRLAACVSGGLKSRSARGHGRISKSGGNASLAEGGERYGEVYAGTKAKARYSQDGPEALSWSPSEDRASTARWSLKGLWRTTGSYSRGAIPRGTGRPKLGNGRVCTMETKALWFLPSVPRCVRATRWGREARDPGRPGRVRRTGMDEMLRHPQTKGRVTENANITLKPAGGRCG